MAAVLKWRQPDPNHRLRFLQRKYCADSGSPAAFLKRGIIAPRRYPFCSSGHLGSIACFARARASTPPARCSSTCDNQTQAHKTGAAFVMNIPRPCPPRRANSRNSSTSTAWSRIAPTPERHWRGRFHPACTTLLQVRACCPHRAFPDAHKNLVEIKQDDVG